MNTWAAGGVAEVGHAGAPATVRQKMITRQCMNSPIPSFNFPLLYIETGSMRKDSLVPGEKGADPWENRTRHEKLENEEVSQTT